MEIVISVFTLLLLWLGYGIYFAPSKKEKTQVVRKFLVPVHYKEELAIYWSGMSGMTVEESIVIAPKHYLVITINGEEDYLWVDKGVWENILPGAEVEIEYSFLFGFLPYVKNFQVQEKNST